MSQTYEKLTVAQRVVEHICSALERGVRPWVRPWEVGAPGVPLRANGERYRGVNALALWAIAAERGFALAHWFTFKQALAIGARVRKGERGAFVIYYAPAEAGGDTSEEEEAPARRTILRGYIVFNAAQIDDLPDQYRATSTAFTPEPGEGRLAAMFARVPAEIRHGGGRAFYAPSADFIVMPERGAFRDGEHYYATLAHELAHWTRHPTRLARDFGAKRFGDRGYALEELTAELASAFIGAEIGLRPDHLEDHASYIASWLEAVRAQPGALLTAAGKAQAAADYLWALMRPETNGNNKVAPSAPEGEVSEHSHDATPQAV